MDGTQKEETKFKSQYFTTEEVEELSSDLMWKLEDVRGECGWPFKINSGYRPGDPNSHGDREAVDIKLWKWSDPVWKENGLKPMSFGQQRQRIHDVARKYGFNRIGLESRHCHLDISKRLPQNVTFIGVSR